MIDSVSPCRQIISVKPSRNKTKPFAPASTTLFFCKIFNCFGVSFNAYRALSNPLLNVIFKSASFASSDSAQARITVIIVPSIGFSIAAYASLTAAFALSTKFNEENNASFSICFANPFKYWAKIIPEFPLALTNAASATASKTSLIDWNCCPVSSIIPCIKEARLLPVSPSATGNTFISLSDFFLLITEIAPC